MGGWRIVIVAIGYGLIVVAVGWMLYKVYVSYKSAGGTDFQLPVYDAAIYPPIIGTGGLDMVLRVYEVTWSPWAYVGIWLGTALLVAGAIRLFEELGDKPLP